MYKKLYPFLLIACASCVDSVISDDEDFSDSGVAEDAQAPNCAPDASLNVEGGIMDSGNEDVDSSIDAHIPDTGCAYQSDADVYVPPVDPPFEYHAYDINHIISTGQSNSVANGASPPLTYVQPYDNLMFNTGVMTARSCGGQVCSTYEVPSSFVPLKEGDGFFDYPVETISSAMANQVTHLYPDHVSLFSLHGRSGNVYSCLRKNSCSWFPYTDVKPFEEGMRQVSDGLRLAQQAGKTYVVRAVTAIHGESDAYNNIFPQPSLNNGCLPSNRVTSYKDALTEWQCTYDKEIKNITNQPEDVPLFISQLSGQNVFRASQVAIDQYEAHKSSNGKVVLVTPTYFIPIRTDCLHFTNAGMQWLGEYFAEAYYQTTIEGKKYEPLQPTNVRIESNQSILITYHVPYPPLVIDTNTVSNPGAFGFDIVSNGQLVIITLVEIVNANTIRLKVNPDSFSMNNTFVRYALNQTPGTCIGPDRGARGNIRDSNPHVSRLGNNLYNWSVQYSELAQP